MTREEYAAVKFFDLFGYPLTKEEARALAYCGYRGVMKPLKEIEGFFVHEGREHLAHTRREQETLLAKKRKRGARFAKLFGLLPWVRAVALCGSVAWGAVKDESDIDFCIITKPGRLWLTRLVLAGALEIFGLRPRPGNTQDKICLSFFITEDALDVSRVLLRDEHGNIDDPNFVFWLATMIPVVNKDNIFDQFLAENDWLSSVMLGLPRAQYGHLEGEARKIPRDPQANGILHPSLRRPQNDWLERLAKRIQEKRMNPEIAEKSCLPKTNVIVSDTLLKLHLNDRREENRRRFHENQHISKPS